jgi:phage N-6-adenine-methyltransferase
VSASVHFSSATDLWATPQAFFDKLNAEFGFELDVCALPENAKCPRYFSPEMDGLAQDWKGVCWMNPPYGRAIGNWMRKAHESATGGLQSSASFQPAQIRLGGTTTPQEARSALFAEG